MQSIKYRSVKPRFTKIGDSGSINIRKEIQDKTIKAFLAKKDAIIIGRAKALGIDLLKEELIKKLERHIESGQETYYYTGDGNPVRIVTFIRTEPMQMFKPVNSSFTYSMTEKYY